MHNGSRTPSDNPAEKRVEWKPDGQQIEPSKKFYLSSTDDDEKSIIRQDQSDSDVNPKPSDCGTSAKDSSERLSKVRIYKGNNVFIFVNVYAISEYVV